MQLCNPLEILIELKGVTRPEAEKVQEMWLHLWELQQWQKPEPILDPEIAALIEQVNRGWWLVNVRLPSRPH